MRKSTKIALAVGAALSLGLAAAGLSAHPFGNEGGYGPGYGMMGGYGPGYGMMGGYGPGMMGGYGPGYGMGGYGPGYGMHGYGPAGYGPGAAEDRLADLKVELGITAKQEGAWNAFVESVKQRDESRQAWFEKRREQGPAASLPERLAQRDEFFKQQQAERQATSEALTKLYAELSPEQKATADRHFGGFGPGYGRGYGPGGRFR